MTTRTNILQAADASASLKSGRSWSVVRHTSLFSLDCEAMGLGTERQSYGHLQTKATINPAGGPFE